TFFSFEEAGIEPDIITLSKSLSGYGLPLALVLLKPELDKWAPGEHNGTFRGHCPAFVTATAELDFWTDGWLAKSIASKEKLVSERLRKIVDKAGITATVRGRGLIWGVAFEDGELAEKISAACFLDGLIIETAGVGGEVLKLLPSLTISEEELLSGLDIIERSLASILKSEAKSAA